MKTLLALIVILGSVQGLSASDLYKMHDYRKPIDDYMEKFNRDMDRTENRLNQQEMIRLQREANRINSSLQSQRGYRYGYGR